MIRKTPSVLWLLDVLALLLSIATFTPLVIPSYDFHPTFAGMPYSMWMGVLVSLLFVLLAYLVSLRKGKIPGNK